MCSIKYVNATICTSVESFRDRETIKNWLSKWEHFIDTCERHSGDWVEMYKVSIVEDALRELPQRLWVDRSEPQASVLKR